MYQTAKTNKSVTFVWGGWGGTTGNICSEVNGKQESVM